MSIGSFFHNILSKIADLFHKIEPDVKNAIHVGVVITDKINNYVQSPVADILTAIIPGELDDAIKAKVREALPKILGELKLADQCGQLTDPNEIVQCAINVLQQIEGDFRAAFLHDISILIAQVAADGKLTWRDGVYLLQYYYEHIYKQKA